MELYVIWKITNFLFRSHSNILFQCDDTLKYSTPERLRTYCPRTGRLEFLDVLRTFQAGNCKIITGVERHGYTAHCG